MTDEKWTMENSMQVIMVMVATVNGRITRGDDPNIYTWTSKEDADFFFSLMNRHTLIIMGSSTYEAAKEKIKPDKDRLRIVLTADPRKYEADLIPGKLEFSNKKPRELLAGLAAEGYKTVLLVGGGILNAAFLQDNLVTDLYLTVEPKIFGTGKPLIGDGEFERSLLLQSVERLNPQGTLLLRYTVLP